MTHGTLTLVLHAHLPFVRHPEYEDFLEEDWLFEAITETYVPLLQAFYRLRAEGLRFRITMSITPPLAAMLDDQLLRSRYRRHLGRLRELAASEVRGNDAGSRIGRIARHYQDRLQQIDGFYQGWGGDLLAAFRELQNDGHLEIVACNATHGFLPLMSGPAPRRAQIRAGIAAYTRTFGRRPRGIWLAECGYDHGIDRLLGDEGIDYFFVDAHGLEYGRPRPARGTHAPMRTPGGPAAFARDHETGRQVWSANEGYPGDPVYREFYRDLGWDASYEYIRRYLHDDGVRRGVGLKYHRITGAVPLHEKDLYDPDAAAWRAREHAQNFVFNRKHQILHLRGTQHPADRAPNIVAMYDAELFGHWWYEGPIFIEEVLRGLAAEPELEAVTPSEYLAGSGGDLELGRPNPSTWGANGTAQVWLNGQVAWMYRFAHWAEREMGHLARRYARSGGLAERALAQAGRELLLMQSSDWAFIVTTGTTAPYAVRRFKRHFQGFQALREGLLSGQLSEADVSAREAATTLFPELDVTAWT
ncbi:MAG TPA: 1,4-alpha-glucan branching protein domain-containing protein [Polyangia bacterium]|nr:1,4-alpha-glucan branching protein domain-containing protein [Polyangia bacterium]